MIGFVQMMAEVLWLRYLSETQAVRWLRLQALQVLAEGGGTPMGCVRAGRWGWRLGVEGKLQYPSGSPVFVLASRKIAAHLFDRPSSNLVNKLLRKWKIWPGKY